MKLLVAILDQAELMSEGLLSVVGLLGVTPCERHRKNRTGAAMSSFKLYPQ